MDGQVKRMLLKHEAELRGQAGNARSRQEAEDFIFAANQCESLIRDRATNAEVLAFMETVRPTYHY